MCCTHVKTRKTIIAATTTKNLSRAWLYERFANGFDLNIPETSVELVTCSFALELDSQTLELSVEKFQTLLLSNRIQSAEHEFLVNSCC